MSIPPFASSVTCWTCPACRYSYPVTSFTPPQCPVCYARMNRLSYTYDCGDFQVLVTLGVHGP
jgi:hypothetical protein